MKNLKLYRNLQDKNLFVEEITIDALSALGNPLEVLALIIDFELFRSTLEDVLLNKDRKSNAGRPQIDVKGDTLWNAEEGDSAKVKKSKKAKKCHKDIDARWTKKRGETVYGYKEHTKVDKGTKLIETYKTTPANVHDSKVVGVLLEESDKGQDLNLDAGYVGKEKEVQKHGMNPVICEKGSKGILSRRSRYRATARNRRSDARWSTCTDSSKVPCTGRWSGA